jgi:hypothetical protein
MMLPCEARVSNDPMKWSKEDVVFLFDKVRCCNVAEALALVHATVEPGCVRGCCLAGSFVSGPPVLLPSSAAPGFERGTAAHQVP